MAYARSPSIAIKGGKDETVATCIERMTLADVVTGKFGNKIDKFVNRLTHLDNCVELLAYTPPFMEMSSNAGLVATKTTTSLHNMRMCELLEIVKKINRPRSMVLNVFLKVSPKGEFTLNLNPEIRAGDETLSESD